MVGNYTCKTFSLATLYGQEPDLSELLERLAKTIRGIPQFDPIDITFSTDVAPDGKEEYSFTVYYDTPATA